MNKLKDIEGKISDCAKKNIKYLLQDAYDLGRKEGPAWKSMASAPKDGTPILVYDKDLGPDGVVRMVAWLNDKTGEATGGKEKDYLWAVIDSWDGEMGGYYPCDRPLCWTEVPTPTEEQINQFKTAQ